jgi:hypothetical protein
LSSIEHRWRGSGATGSSFASAQRSEILRQFVPLLEDLPEIRVRRQARVIQVRDLTF